MRAVAAIYFFCKEKPARNSPPTASADYRRFNRLMQWVNVCSAHVAPHRRFGPAVISHRAQMRALVERRLRILHHGLQGPMMGKVPDLPGRSFARHARHRHCCSEQHGPKSREIATNSQISHVSHLLSLPHWILWTAVVTKLSAGLARCLRPQIADTSGCQCAERCRGGNGGDSATKQAEQPCSLNRRARGIGRSRISFRS